MKTLPLLIMLTLLISCNKNVPIEESEPITVERVVIKISPLDSTSTLLTASLKPTTKIYRAVKSGLWMPKKEVGQKIEKGDTIGVIEHRPLKSAIYSQQVRVKKSKSSYERSDNLYNKGATTVVKRDDAKFSYLLDRAKLKELYAQRSEFFIISDVDGTISKLNRDKNIYAERGARLITVTTGEPSITTPIAPLYSSLISKLKISIKGVNSDSNWVDVSEKVKVSDNSLTIPFDSSYQNSSLYLIRLELLNSSVVKVTNLESTSSYNIGDIVEITTIENRSILAVVLIKKSSTLTLLTTSKKRIKESEVSDISRLSE